jgi:hypothetical protein
MSSASDLWGNEYGAPAGKGAKARQRLRLHDINANTMNVDKPKKKYKSKPKVYEQKPEHIESDRKRLNMSEAYYKASGLKSRVRILVADYDISFLELMDVLKQEGLPLSGVAAGNLRTEMRDCMKLLDAMGLIDRDALARRRKKIKAGDAV